MGFMELDALRKRLAAHGQEHLLEFADALTAEQRAKLVADIQSLDLEQLARLYELSKKPHAEIDPHAVQPMEAISLPTSDAERSRDQEMFQVGLERLRTGKVGVVLVAGGQGTRLGFEHPKGMFPIGPVSGASLFQIHAEKILAWSRKAGKPIPWYIMTSPNNHQETAEFFASQRYFGLPREDVRFFVQGTMPALELENGKVLLSQKHEVFTGPNGHGGTLLAMKSEGVLADLAARGIEDVYYFQVDNVFVKILDPVFLGHHHHSGANVSIKVIRKEHAEEKLGLAVRYQGKPTVIEYSDLPSELGGQIDAHGQLRYWTGSIAIHVFERAFLDRITAAGGGLPFHFARKAVPYINSSGELTQPKKPNALKFETFIFDCLPMAERVMVLETDRHDEYEPVKNSAGEHSPALVQAAMTRKAASWLKAAGIPFPQNSTGESAVPLEVSPLAALNEEEFTKRFAGRPAIQKATYFQLEGP
ncbi:MAG: UDPGP type 1 family protein [Planctomycetota bacterium]